MQEVLTFVQGFCAGALVPIGGFLIYLKRWEHKDSERRDNEAAKKMLNRFNIYCSQKRGWLPPNYGRTTYSKMTEQERAVVDEFHGDGSAGSGQSA